MNTECESSLQLTNTPNISLNKPYSIVFRLMSLGDNSKLSYFVFYIARVCTGYGRIVTIESSIIIKCRIHLQRQILQHFKKKTVSFRVICLLLALRLKKNTPCPLTFYPMLIFLKINYHLLRSV